MKYKEAIELDLSSTKLSTTIQCASCNEQWIQEVVLDKELEAKCKHFTYTMYKVSSGDIETVYSYKYEQVRVPRKKAKKMLGVLIERKKFICIKPMFPLTDYFGNKRKYIFHLTDK